MISISPWWRIGKFEFSDRGLKHLKDPKTWHLMIALVDVAHLNCSLIPNCKHSSKLSINRRQMMDLNTNSLPRSTELHVETVGRLSMLDTSIQLCRSITSGTSPLMPIPITRDTIKNVQSVDLLDQGGPLMTSLSLSPTPITRDSAIKIVRSPSLSSLYSNRDSLLELLSPLLDSSGEESTLASEGTRSSLQDSDLGEISPFPAMNPLSEGNIRTQDRPCIYRSDQWYDRYQCLMTFSKDTATVVCLETTERMIFSHSGSRGRDTSIGWREVVLILL